MSRTEKAQPEHRLRFDYPYIEIEPARGDPQRVALDQGDPARELRYATSRLGPGRVTAVLPEAEVWRGRISGAGGRDAAERAASRALGAPADALTLALGPAGSDGLRACAAIRSDTLDETRDFLARAGLRAARITGAGAFPGFDAPPTFTRFALNRAFAGAEARQVAAGSGIAAAIGLALWLAPWQGAAPTEQAAASTPLASSAAIPAAAIAPVEVAPVAVPQVRQAEVVPAPTARPEGLRPAEAQARIAVRPAAEAVSLSSRNAPAGMTPPANPLNVALPERIGRPPARPVATAQPDAAVPTQAAEPAVVAPRARPLSAQATTAEPKPSGVSETPTERSALAGGPQPRPAMPAAPTPAALVSAVAVPAALAAATLGPRSRPDALVAPPVRVASLAVTNDAGPSLTMPEPRRIVETPKPAAVAARPAAPAPVAKAAPTPAPQTIRAAAPPAAKPLGPTKTVRVKLPSAKIQQASKPPVITAPTRTAARPAAATVRPTRVAVAVPAAPVRQAAKPVAAAPVRKAAEPARQPTRAAAAQQPARGSAPVELIGIFGGSSGRHALVQMPNGSTERVRAGDQVQGVQVTAVSADTVHLRSRGRDSILRLPQ